MKLEMKKQTYEKWTSKNKTLQSLEKRAVKRVVGRMGWLGSATNLWSFGQVILQSQNLNIFIHETVESFQLWGM